MAPRQGSEAESPTADDELEVDAADEAAIENPPAEAQPEAEAEPEPQDTPPADAADAEVAAAEDEPGEQPKAAAPAKPKPKEAKPSPVDEAIAHLTTPEKAPTTDTPAATKPTDPAAAKPDDAKAKDAAPAPGAQPNDDDDALADWSPEERKHTKGKVKERFRKVTAEVKELRPLAEIGRHWDGLAEQRKLREDFAALDNDDAIEVAVRTQASAIRVARAARSGQTPSAADVAWLEQNREAIDMVLGMAGRKPTAPAEDLSKVVISPEVRELRDAFGVVKDEDELRAIQATLNRVRAAKAQPEVKPAATQPPAPVAAAPAAPAAPVRGWSDEDDRLARVGMQQDLVAAGVPPERIKAHYENVLTPIITSRVKALYPSAEPRDVWQRLQPSSRRELVREAHTSWAAAQRAPAATSAPRRAPAPPPVQGTGSRPALRANGKALRPVDAAIAHLSGEEIE